MPGWIEVILRTLSSIAILFILTKILGKRQVSQLSLFEYITGITIGSLAAYVSLELDGSWMLAVIAMIVWSVVTLGLEYLQLKSKTVRNFLDGKATVVIQKGKILEDELKKERLTADELLEQLRRKSVFNIADVEFAVMEPSGEITALLTKENQPLTAKQLGMQVGSEAEPNTVIMDGETLSEGLLASGFQQGWIDTELEKLGVKQQDVFLGQVDALGQLQVDLYDDQMEVPKANEQKILWATLRKCEADLEIFALSTDDSQTKQLYQKCTQKINRVIENVKPYLH